MSDTMPEPEGDPEVELETVLDDAEGGLAAEAAEPEVLLAEVEGADAGPVGVDPADVAEAGDEPAGDELADGRADDELADEDEPYDNPWLRPGRLVRGAHAVGLREEGQAATSRPASPP